MYFQTDIQAAVPENLTSYYSTKQSRQKHRLTDTQTTIHNSKVEFTDRVEDYVHAEISH